MRHSNDLLVVDLEVWLLEHSGLQGFPCGTRLKALLLLPRRWWEALFVVLLRLQLLDTWSLRLSGIRALRIDHVLLKLPKTGFAALLLDHESLKVIVGHNVSMWAVKAKIVNFSL